MTHQNFYVDTGRRGSIGEYVCEDDSPDRSSIVLLASAIGISVAIAGLTWRLLTPSTTAKINRRLKVIDLQRENWQKAA